MIEDDVNSRMNIFSDVYIGNHLDPATTTKLYDGTQSLKLFGKDIQTGTDRNGPDAQNTRGKQMPRNCAKKADGPISAHGGEQPAHVAAQVRHPWGVVSPLHNGDREGARSLWAGGVLCPPPDLPPFC